MVCYCPCVVVCVSIVVTYVSPVPSKTVVGAVLALYVVISSVTDPPRLPFLTPMGRRYATTLITSFVLG